MGSLGQKTEEQPETYSQQAHETQLAGTHVGQLT
jgi:hypothetical protein